MFVRFGLVCRIVLVGVGHFGYLYQTGNTARTAFSFDTASSSGDWTGMTVLDQRKTHAKLPASHLGYGYVSFTLVKGLYSQ